MKLLELKEPLDCQVCLSSGASCTFETESGTLNWIRLVCACGETTGWCLNHESAIQSWDSLQSYMMIEKSEKRK